MRKVNIVNCLITRKCNLRCDYCRISGDINYILKPGEYPKSKELFENEKDATWWLSTIDRLYNHNNDIFFILYGGEPFMEVDKLIAIVDRLNELNANYTIISNCSDSIQPNIKKLFDSVKTVKGFTASIDPGFWLHLPDYNSGKKLENDEFFKSCCGFNTLKRLKEEGLVSDPVAEITCDVNSISKLYETISRLSKLGIYSDVTVIDSAKNNFYDFACDVQQSLITPTEQIRKVFDKLKNSDLLVHMKDTILDSIYNMLPSNGDCEIEKLGLHNLTIDSDGSLRLCLRIRGHHIVNYEPNDLFDEFGDPLDNEVDISKRYKSGYGNVCDAMNADKQSLCNGCCWSCMIMSKDETTNNIVNH